MVNNFSEQLKESENPILIENWKKIIRSIPLFGSDAKIVSKKSLEAQLEFNTDWVVTTKKGRSYTLDTKALYNLNYSTFLFELKQHHYSDPERKNCIRSIPGWLYESNAGYVLMAHVDKKNNYSILDWVLFSLQPFKDRPDLVSSLRLIPPSPGEKRDFYTYTICAIVSIPFLRENAHTFSYSGDLVNQKKGDGLFVYS